MKSKPSDIIIGVVAQYNNSHSIAIEDSFIDYLSYSLGINIAIIPFTIDTVLLEPELEHFDGIILPGGRDINPFHYNQIPYKGHEKFINDLDILSISIIQICLRKKIPILGVCRGCQIMNIALDGTLIQDLKIDKVSHWQQQPYSETSHNVFLYNKPMKLESLPNNFMVNSMHHQGIDKLGKNIIPFAFSEDGLIEGITITNHPFFIGVQWHPEYIRNKNESLILGNAFIKACINYSNLSKTMKNIGLRERYKLIQEKKDEYLNIFVWDDFYGVRLAVADCGRPQDLDVLVHDMNSEVRRSVLRHKRMKDLAILINDKNQVIQDLARQYIKELNYQI